jgi:hypothetical protein
MKPSIFQSTLVQGILSASLSMAITTSQANARGEGGIDRSYLLGVFSAHRSTAKALCLPWPRIVADSLRDMDALDVLVDRIEELAKRPLDHLIDEIERELLEAFPRPQD